MFHYYYYNNILFLTAWSRVLPQKLPGLQQLKKFPNFVKPECSLPHLQVPAAPVPILSQINPLHVPIPLYEDPS